MIILTGASGGIGHAILPSLAKLDDVIAVYHTKEPALDNMQRITPFKVDITSEQEIDDFVASIKSTLKKITLIHAATLNQDGLLAQFKTNDWDSVIDVNLRANFLLTRKLILPMLKENWGRVIHFSSVAGAMGTPGTIAYSTAKTGLLGMSRVIANEYARFNITSNVLMLGYFHTGLAETLSEKIRKTILEKIPSGRLGDPENIVNAIDFLIKSDYVNGSSIHIDGGI